MYIYLFFKIFKMRNFFINLLKNAKNYADKSADISKKKSHREILKILFWKNIFAKYIIIIANKHKEKELKNHERDERDAGDGCQCR